MWQRAKRYVWKDIDQTDREGYKQRMKFPVHVPDMILINYLKQYAIENNQQFNDVFDGPPDAVVDAYPEVFWRKRLTELGVSSDMILRKLKNQTLNQGGPTIPTIPGVPATSPSGGTEAKSDVWLKALLKWKEFLETSDNTV